MKARLWKCMVVLSIFSALAVTVRLKAQAGPAPSGPPKYRVFALGALGGNSSDGNAINNLGWVLGEANITGNTAVHATLWNNDLGTLGGPDSDIQWPNKNDQGVLAGIAETSDVNPLGEAWSCSAFFLGPTGYDCVGFTWQNGVMTALPTLGGYNGFAASINNRGQVAGWAENTVHDPTCITPQVLQFRAAVWEPDGQVRQLPPFAGDLDSAATAINDLGEVVGISGACDVAVGATSAKHALLWTSDGQVVDMHNLGGHSWNTPMDINNRGEVVGFANAEDLPLVNGQPPAVPVPFYWSKETVVMRQLPLLPNDVNGVAYGINNWGQAVGASNDPSGITRAVIWQDGKVTDLNQQLVAQNSPLFLALAQGINDRGEITGFAVDSTNGELLAFVAVPAFDSGSESDADSYSVRANATANVVVPESARKQLQRRWPFALMGRKAAAK